ncbi:protein MODIFIER OF SNC1 1-like isoform X2 [Cicer arietinum]|uniref:Protein MODIFIER OF SNC1 1-like isoform X2 n=1 Tax=Cicer arietinum TaxID=3827 RepID=A0A1S2YBJ3_CICAR|nr:protein MODIFIER OF SNC1 1-like isoform X2 [Cicer arietinum]
MTSSMLSGERRWASSTRKGGMTVLGKVAVPKPINLPSQRLENHGIDPNVEIVPKGTLSWGSKSPSSALSAWGSSVSPNASGGASSPSQLSARPSSGGSGTRPSTSGSDSASELTSRAWGSNSRPSSSSGVLTSSRTSQTSLRPRSAETRPSSSELSRFAEHVTENSVAWDVGRTAEKLGITQCKNDDFSLRSGDFPTLGSEKDKSVPNSELQDHDSHIRPDSSAGLGKEKNETSTVVGVPVHANRKGETENSWRRDYQAFNEDGMGPGIEKWRGNLPPFPNAVIPPQHFDVWCGAPVNNHQGGIWLRGPPNGPPFGTPVAPGGFPIEPFPFYRPHIPPTGFANPPQIPPHGCGPTGHHKNGEVYRPHMPDAYIPPGMPLRPGFYPGPMAYEGYYGPPMGYCNSNERDVHFMGMAAGPSVYNRNPSQNPPETGNSHSRSGGLGPAVKQLALEPVESSHSPDTSRPYRVLLKQHNEWDRKNEPTNWEDSLTKNASYANVRDQPRMSVQENDHRWNTEMDLKRTSSHGKAASSQTSGNQGSSSVNNAKSLESTGSFNRFDNISAKKTDGVASNTLEISSRLSSAPKDSTLIQKIEGLNAKARDVSSTKSKEERRNKFHAGSHVENEASGGGVFPEATLAAEPRQITHGMQGRGNYRKGRLNTRDTDDWRKKPGVIDSSTSSGVQLEASSILVGEHHISVDAYERSRSYSQVRSGGESMQTLSDSADSHEQRAKTNELAKQGTKQLQKEEVEWNKKQKAKSLVKLEEVNKRTQAVKGSMQKVYAANSALQNKKEEFQPFESATVLSKSGAANSSVMPNDNDACQNVVNHIQSVALDQDVNCADDTNAIHLQAHNNVDSKQKRAGYKQKHNLSLGKTLNVSTTSTSAKDENDKMDYVSVSSGSVTNEVSSAFVSGLPMNSTSMVESSVNPKRKNNPSSKNKEKVEEISLLGALPTTIPQEANHSTSFVENKLMEDIELDQGLLQSSSLSKDPNQNSEQRYSENEESYGKMNRQLKSQHSRRMPRHMQANRQADNSHGSDVLMWAPVKPPNKVEKIKIEVIVPSKSDQKVNSIKNKRAEMERYVPKPVAKEMAQQGSLQRMVSSISQVPMDECVDAGSQGVGKVGSVMESKNGDSWQTRAWKGKTHGSWRQRNSTESNDVHDMQDGVNRGSSSYQNIQIPMERQQVQMSETSLLKGQSKYANETSKPDGINNPANHDSDVPVYVPIIKDHKAMVRERQVPFRRQKDAGVNHDVDLKKNAGATRKTETLVSSSVHNQPDIKVVLKESQSIGEHGSSHWQPKFQASNNQRGNRPKKKEFSLHVGVSFPDGQDKESSPLIAQPPSQLVSEKSKGREVPNLGIPEAIRESRNAPRKGHVHSPNHVAVSSSEQAPTSMDPRHRQHPSSGVRKNGNHNRFGKVHESQGDWNSHGQDNRHYHDRERQGSNHHYEYHAVGPHGDSKSDNSDRSKDDSYHTGGRFRERGQTNSRRGGGNFSGR